MSGVSGGSGTSGYVTPAAPLRAFVEELVLAGVREVVVCPGSRSMPLALALRGNPGIRVWMHLDERAGAFFALGMARASRRPTAILTTSGTATVNVAPAVVEAHEGRVPLVVLTADRPPELRDRGAPQAIDQTHLYGRFAKWFAELPVPDEDPALIAHLRGVVGRAVAIAREAPAGPVHLDLPFREPLVPAGSLQPQSGVAPGEVPYVDLLGGARVVPPAALDGLVGRVAAAGRGLIVCGPLDAPGFAPALARLAEVTGFPILADALSNVRLGTHDRSHVVGRHDAVVRAASFRDGHVPDLVLRFGGTPTSKAVATWLSETGVPQLVIDDGGWSEPTLAAVTMVHAEPVALAAALAGALSERAAAGQPAAADPAWLEAWLEADRAADVAIREWLAALDEPFEGCVFAEMEHELPDGALVVAGNSMPVRDLDAFLPSSPAGVRCIANRGANGIDGVVSTALGAAAVHDGPVVLVVGDLSFIHDLNALVAARLHRLSLTIVLVNNDGGGIFSFLPQAAAERPEVGLPEHFEQLMGTPHGLDLRRIAEALGADVGELPFEDLAIGVRDSMARPGVHVVEQRTDRERNVTLHRECLARVADAIARLPVRT